jgi:hypothetical protein
LTGGKKDCYGTSGERLRETPDRSQSEEKFRSEKMQNRFAYLYKLSYIYASAVLEMGPRFRFAVAHGQLKRRKQNAK